MFFSDEIRRTAHARIDRFHREAAARTHRRSFRSAVATRLHRVATWIEPQKSRPQGARYASE